MPEQDDMAMDIGSEPWCRLLVAGAGQLGVALTTRHTSQFARHAQLLLEWNRKINLTAITDPRAMAIKHFLDAIAPLAQIPEMARLLDIGTGAGFPGLPLKVVRPQQAMTLIDASRKKVSFVNHVIRALGLEQVQALQVRAEDFGRCDAYRHRFEVIVSRALAEIPLVMSLAEPLLSPGGRIILFQARHSEKYLPLDQAVGQRFDTTTIDYRLPLLGDQRCLVVLRALS